MFTFLIEGEMYVCHCISCDRVHYCRCMISKNSVYARQNGKILEWQMLLLDGYNVEQNLAYLCLLPWSMIPTKNLLVSFEKQETIE